MQPYEYLLEIDEQFHDEAYELIGILEISVVDEDMERQQAAASERIRQLIELSK